MLFEHQKRAFQGIVRRVSSEEEKNVKMNAAQNMLISCFKIRLSLDVAFLLFQKLLQVKGNFY